MTAPLGVPQCVTYMKAGTEIKVLLKKDMFIASDLKDFR